MSCDNDYYVQGTAKSSDDVVLSIKTAIALQRRGSLGSARDILEQLTKEYPGDCRVSFALGKCLFSSQDFQGVHQAGFLALACKPCEMSALAKKGDCLYRIGDLKGAGACYENVMEKVSVNELSEEISLKKECRRKLAATLTDLGVLCKNNGELTNALLYSDKAIQTDPTYSTAFYNLAVLYSDMRDQFPSIAHWLGHHAKSLYMRALELSPSHVEVLNNLGVICKGEGNLGIAVQCYRMALRLRPDFDVAKKNLATTLSSLGCESRAVGDDKKARYLFKEALCIDPTLADAHYNLGVSYMDSRQLNKAILYFNLSLQFNPCLVAALHNLGVIFKELNQFERSLAMYNKALACDPALPQTLNNLAVIHTIMGNPQDAFDAINKAIHFNPQYVEAYNNLGVICRDLGNVVEAIKAYEDCLAFDLSSANPSQNRLLAMNYLDSVSTNEIFLASLRWGIRLQSSITPFKEWRTKSDGKSRNLHVGYLSPDFFTHSVSYFIEGPLRHHTGVSVTLFSKTAREDARTEVFRSLGHRWRNLVGISDSETAAIIRDDQIDILVELAGHTSGNSLNVMAYKPARIQCSWIGYPNTTGLETIDFRITDSNTDPPDTRQAHVEKLMRMPNCFLCYSPPSDLPNVSPVPACDVAGFVTFGTFNALAKLDKRVVQCWKKILDSVPRSRLLLKAKPFSSPLSCVQFRSKMKSQGFDELRLDLLPLTSGIQDHLSKYDMLDIALDTFPYAGTTTTCEALLMSVPVVTLATDSCHAQNVGASLLRNAGLPELVAATEDEFVDIAVKLAGSRDRLNSYRANLRKQFLESTVCDAKQFTSDLEVLYSEMCE